MDQSFALTTECFVYSWGYNNWCQLGHDLEKLEVLYNPKIVKIGRIWRNKFSNIICLASGGRNTYFRTNEELIYFCGYLGKNKFQKLPKLIDINIRVDSLAFIRQNRSFKCDRD